MGARVRTLSRFCILILFTVCCQTLMACPTCKDGVDANDPTHSGMAAGYYWSILFMMSMPFIILGVLGTCMYWSIQSAQAKLAAERAIQLQNERSGLPAEDVPLAPAEETAVTSPTC